ncbi:YDG/SRA domain-containing protein [Flavobacterium microcysteis]
MDGNAKDGVAAIVLSGGYEDDLDSGDEIIYTGAGGNDRKGKQIEDQSWDKRDNKGLLISMDRGLPIIYVVQNSLFVYSLIMTNMNGLINLNFLIGNWLRRIFLLLMSCVLLNYNSEKS